MARSSPASAGPAARSVSANPVDTLGLLGPLGEAIVQAIEGARKHATLVLAEQRADLGLELVGDACQSRMDGAPRARDDHAHDPPVGGVTAALDQTLGLQAVEVADERRALDGHAG